MVARLRRAAMRCISKPSGAGRLGGSQSDAPHRNAHARPIPFPKTQLLNHESRAFKA